jgi:hypothetical protein
MSAKLSVEKVPAELEKREAFHRDQEARAQGKGPSRGPLQAETEGGVEPR